MLERQVQSKEKRSTCSTLVIKVASRCNLACTYCYMYFLGDTSYKSQPKRMRREVVKAMIDKVKVICQDQGLNTFNFVFHGGEPLLAGKLFFKDFIEYANTILLPEIFPTFLIQTNGTMFDEEWCEMFNHYRVFVGISLDGIAVINDKHRVDHQGKGTYHRVVQGIETFNKYSKIGSPGLLSVVNLDADPVEFYRHFKQLKPSSIECMLPDATYEQLPYKLSLNGFSSWETPYADWLIKVFDYWFADKDNAVNIRLFESIIISILGGETVLDTIGSASNEVLVIETDGSIEPPSQLKICGEAFTKLNMNILDNSFAEAQANELVDLYVHSGTNLCNTCNKCPIKEVCGGGYLAHRYKNDNGFNNPSVYCHDLAKLIVHIQNRALGSVYDDSDMKGVQLLSFSDVKSQIQKNAIINITSQRLEQFGSKSKIKHEFLV